MNLSFFERLKRFVTSFFNRVRSLVIPHAQESTDARVTGLDFKVMKKVRPGAWPRWHQIKYIGKFFTPTERHIFFGAGIVATLSTCALFTFFIKNHTTLVPKSGGDYSEALIGQPKYINPLFASASDVDSDITSLIYSSLFTYDENGKLVPELAEGYTLSDDKKTYTIHLRSDVRWSDGTVFNANDVLYTWDMIQSAEVGSPLYAIFQSVTIDKPDERTIRFTLQQPFAPFLDSLTVGILPEHIWSQMAAENMKLAKNNIQPVGSGAWKFEKLVKDDTGYVQTYTLTRNDYFFGTKPFIQTLSFKFFPDYTSAIDAVRGQTVDGLSFVPRETRNKLLTKNIVNYDLHLPQYTALFFNVANDLAKNVEMRKALGNVINKQELINAAIHGEGFLVDGPILPGALGYDDNLKRVSVTTEEANEALDKIWTRLTPGDYFKIIEGNLIKANATTTPDTTTSSTATTSADALAAQVRGGMDPEQQFYRHSKNGNIITFTLATADTPEYHAVADYIVKQWRALGIQTVVTFVSPRQLSREILRTHDYTALLYGEIVGNDPDLYPFWHSSQIAYPGLNVSQWGDKNGDKLLVEARATFDTDKRADLYRQFQKILIDQTPAIFLYSPSHIFAVNKRIKGITLSVVATPESRYRGLSTWFIQTAVAWKK